MSDYIVIPTKKDSKCKKSFTGWYLEFSEVGTVEKQIVEKHTVHSRTWSKSSIHLKVMRVHQARQLPGGNLGAFAGISSRKLQVRVEVM